MAKTRKAKDTPAMDGNVSRQTFLEHYDVITEKLRVKKEADSALATAYKAAERNGLSRKELKRARDTADLTAEERTINDRRYRLYLDWLGKPIGTQADAEPTANGHATADPAETEAVQKHENNEAYEWGISAGKAGAALESMPYTPGTEEYQSAASGWAIGQKQAVEALGGATHHAESRPS